MALPREFFVSRPVGSGPNNPNDLVRVRKALHRTGHMISPSNPSGTYTPVVASGIANFQRDWGLEPDGVILPGGPTDQAINVALAFDREGGRETVDLVRKPYAALSRAGLTPEPDPDDPDAPFVWRDAEGKAQSPEELASLLRDSGQEPPPSDASDPRAVRLAGLGDTLLFLPAVIPPLLAGIDYTQKSLKDWRPSTARPTNRADEEAEPPQSLADELGMDRTMPVELPREAPQGPPPDPTGNKVENIPPQEPLPTFTVFPIGESGPSMTVSPDMSDELEQWLVLENSRGSPEGQQKDVQFIIDYLYGELIRRGIRARHRRGGYHPPHSNIRPDDGEEIPEEGTYMPERLIPRYTDKFREGRRPDITQEIGEGDERETLDINVQDMRGGKHSDERATKREEDALEEIKKLKEARGEKGDTLGYPKSKGWNWTDWENEMGRRINEYLDAKYGKVPK